jgi:SAM-dependent methyltransferase
MIDPGLLRDMLRVSLAQPATAVWRAVEIDALLRVGFPPGRGLDLGCGDGKLTAVILARTGPRRLVGVDPDPFETAAAQQSGVYEAVHTAPGDSIPEPSESFDFVLSNSVLEHIPHLEPVLREVARLLRPGGKFLFTVPGPGFHRLLRGSLRPWIPRDRYLHDLDRRLAHLRYPTGVEWGRLCAEAGLSLHAALGYLDRDETRTWETMSRFTGGLFYQLWGKRQPPVRIQRDLGLRRIQHSTMVPTPLAAAFGAIIRSRVNGTSRGWLAEEAGACLLVHGTRS